MNNKRVNFCLAITNTVAIIVCVIFIIFRPELEYTTSLMIDEVRNLFNNSIIEFFMGNIHIIGTTIYMTIVIANIVSAFQNRENRKLSFWQLVLSLYIILSVAIPFLIPDEYNFINHILNILYYVVPIILAIKNLICIKKNKPLKIQILSYILVILFNTILFILNVITDFQYNTYIYLWFAIILVMQFIYTIRQNEIVENKSRKIFNILFYYILIPIIVLCYTFLTIYSITANKIEISNYQIESQNLNQCIYELNCKDDEYLFAVCNNGKYGFITSDGKLVIDLKYDGVSSFLETEINNTIYYFALAERDNNYFFISKSGKEIILKNKTQVNNCFDMTEELNEAASDIMNEKGAKIITFNTVSFLLLGEEYNVKVSTNLYERTTIELDEIKTEQYTADYSTYSYNNENYSITIEPLEDQGSFYTLCNVTVNQRNGNTYTNKEYIYNLSLDEITLYSDGYIGFKTEDGSIYGWYDNYGNKKYIKANNFTLEDVKNNILILYNDNNYYFYNMSGVLILSTDFLLEFKTGYLIKKNLNEYVLLDENLNEISSVYEFIFSL